MNKEELKEQIKSKQEELKKLIIPYCVIEVTERQNEIKKEQKQLKWYQWYRRIKLNKKWRRTEQVAKRIIEFNATGNFELLWAIPFDYYIEHFLLTTIFIKIA